MPTQIVTAFPLKRTKIPTKSGPKLSRVIVGKQAPEPETPESPSSTRRRSRPVMEGWAPGSSQKSPAREGEGKFAVGDG